VLAAIGDDAKITANGGSILVNATNAGNVMLINVAVAASTSTEGVSVGGSLSVLNPENTAIARIGSATIAGAKLYATGDIIVQATNAPAADSDRGQRVDQRRHRRRRHVPDHRQR
jgi:hypothetical protein